MTRFFSLGWVLLTAGVCGVQAQQATWVGTWASAPMDGLAAFAPGPQGATYRNIVHVSLGGSTIRVTLSNEFGSRPLRVGGVHAGLSAGKGAIVVGSDRAVRFDGKDSVVIPAGAVALSDAVALPLPALGDLAVSVYVPGAAEAVPVTGHRMAASTNYVADGNAAAAETMSDARPAPSWFYVKGVDVQAAPGAEGLVVLGASISEGYHSTVDANARWSDELARRLVARRRGRPVGVMNEGISGNRLLHDDTGQSALARLDRDVLSQSGARWLVVALGTNDIGRTYFGRRAGEDVTAEEMLWAMRQIVLRAHARGMLVMGTTLSPFAGAGYYNAAGETMRQAVNAGIRNDAIFDAVADFDAVTRDPADPTRLQPAMDSGDHLHPNDAGYKVMGDAIDLKLFER